MNLIPDGSQNESIYLNNLDFWKVISPKNSMLKKYENAAKDFLNNTYNHINIRKQKYHI